MTVAEATKLKQKKKIMNCCYSRELKDKKPDKERGSEKTKHYKQCVVYSLNMKTNTSVHSSDLVKLTSIYQELDTAREYLIFQLLKPTQ